MSFLYLFHILVALYSQLLIGGPYIVFGALNIFLWLCWLVFSPSNVICLKCKMDLAISNHSPLTFIQNIF